MVSGTYIFRRPRRYIIKRSWTIANETGAIVYDTLFLALAEDALSVMITADGRLLKVLEGTRYASLASSLKLVENLMQ